MIKKKKSNKFNVKAVNVFRNCEADNLDISDHFLERWNERVGRLRFEKKDELAAYINRNYNNRDVEHLWGDHYLIDGIMGGIYVTARREGEKVVLITTLGTYTDNPIIYNMITSGEINKTIRKYGKIDLAFAV